ncbi:MAG: hypothetical protein ACO4CT_02405 [Planctomycetota bacterium]
MIDKLLPVLLLLGCSSAGQPTEGNTAASATAPFTERLAEAERLLRAGDPDGALLITDEVLKADDRNLKALTLAARGNIALFQTGRQGAEWFLDDAVRQLERALRVAPTDADSLTTLSWCLLQKSEFSRGAEVALEAASILEESGAEQTKIADALLQAAESQLQTFVAERRTEIEEGAERPGTHAKKLANVVLVTLNNAATLGRGATANIRASQVHQWLGLTNEAVADLELAVRAEPTAAAPHEALQSLLWGMDMRTECVATYKRLLRELPGATAIQWYLGRAQLALGDDHRATTRWDDARSAYEQALQTYESYDAARPRDHALTSHSIAVCKLSLARIAVEQGQLDTARDLFFAAYDANPNVAEYADGMPRIYDSFGGNYLGGLALIGSALAEQTDAGALRRSLEFFESILARHPGRFGAIYNNAALSARDLGSQVANEADGDAARRTGLAEAMALWEKSYTYYRQAVELEPNDPRIVNDCGLMLIYHLNRDLDLARELCAKAVTLGEAQLAELGDDAPEEQRRFLEEAVGDAYQNLGVLAQDRLGRPESEWRGHYENSVRYYPYQRREAAMRLRTAEASAPQQDPRQKKFDAQIGKGKDAAAAGDYDTALLVLDEMAKEMNGFPPFHYHAGIWSLAYGKKAAADGGNPGLVDGLFQDALRNLLRAVELDGEPNGPRLALCEAQLAVGDAAAAAATANDLLSHIRSAGGADEDTLGQVHALRAEAAARAFVAARQEGKTDEDLLRAMRASFREIENTARFDDAKRGLWIATEQWANAPEQAVQIMVRAYERNPGLIGELVQAGASAGASQPVIDALAPAKDATSIWWRGRAHFDLAVQLWSSGKGADGVKAIDAGIALFEKSMAENAGFADSCRQWIALCLGQRGMIQISLDKIDDAETSLLEATERAPEVFTSDIGGGSSIKRGILVVADRHFQKRDLGRCVAIYRRVGAAVPGDVDIANNEGLFCRDHADALGGRRGQLTDELRDLYEASYAAYTRASQLDPSNVRLRNDRALILVYSLRRELELAEEILDSAVRDGQRQLDENPPEDSGDLRNLQEAVGDAHGNLAVLYFEQKRYPEARKAATKSFEYYPFQRRAGAGLIRQIDAAEKKEQEGKGGQSGKDGE